MSTGATKAQIERAAHARYAWDGLPDDDYGEYAEHAMDEAHRFAAALVPETAVIVDRADVVIALDGFELDCRDEGFDERVVAIGRLWAAIDGGEG